VVKIGPFTDKALGTEIEDKDLSKKIDTIVYQFINKK
jgi:hypothetical protein